MLKENGYQESIINKILKKLLTITALLVKMRNLSNRYSEGSHQNKFKFHVCCRFLWKNNISNQVTQKYDHLLKTLCKNLCKPKHRAATEDKSNIVHEIDCNN